MQRDCSPFSSGSPTTTECPSSPNFQATSTQRVNDVSTTSSSLVHRRRSISSHRRKSPDYIIGLDAPTQPRRYLTASATSKKEIPAFFAKMRSHSPNPDDEEDELVDEPLAPNASDQEKIEWKRRQNTLAARRSRRRKLMHQQQLEESVRQLSLEKELWKTRATTLRQLLQSHDIPFPEFSD